MSIAKIIEDQLRRTAWVPEARDIAAQSIAEALSDYVHKDSVVQVKPLEWVAGTALQRSARAMGLHYILLATGPDVNSSWSAVVYIDQYTPEAIGEGALLEMQAACQADLQQRASAIYEAGARDRLQQRIKPWMLECFGAALASDRTERCDRFIEEAAELVQSIGYSEERAHAVIRWKFGDPAGRPAQEVGGVMLTLAALCSALDIDMDTAGRAEMARVEAPEVIKKIQAKQNRKLGEIEAHMRVARTPELEDAARRACYVLDAYIQDHGDIVTEGGVDSVDAYNALRSALSRAEEPGWQPIESAPKDGSLVLLTIRKDYGKGKAIVRTSYWTDDVAGRLRTGWAHVLTSHVATDWMPVPPPALRSNEKG